MPERFDLSYIGPDNQKHRPVMVHRVVFGSIERFIAILTEHFAGAFPLWLAPVQVVVLPITDAVVPYAQEVLDHLLSQGFRAEMDARQEKIGYRIREAQVQKIPYMVVLGGREAEAHTLSVRSRKSGQSQVATLADFSIQLQAEADARAL